MAINIQHTYSTHADIYYDRKETHHLSEYLVGTIDELTEHACEMIVKHNFSTAEICSYETGEILAIVERT